MPVILDHFISGILITTPPLFYIFVNDPGSSLVEVVTIPRESDDFEEDDEEITPADTSKNEEINEKLGKVGIDSRCFLENLKTVGKCELNKEEMERINFPDKEEEEDFEIKGLGDGETVTLTIESGYDEEDFIDGLRLTFNSHNPNRLEISGGYGDTSLYPYVDYDYKFSYVNDKGLEGPWNLQSLGAKVGLNINDSLDNDTCAPGKVKHKKLNIWRSEEEYVIGAVTKPEIECLMEATEENKNHLGGYKLSLKDKVDTSLVGGKGPKKGKTIDSIGKDSSYSIGPKDIKGRKVWFLIENK